MALTQPDILTGAYVTADQLLSLRFRPTRPPHFAASTITGTRAGLRLSQQKGRGVDFAEVRQYQPGDDTRSIDWRVTARKNLPHTKVFREERERPALLFVDQGQHMFFGSTQRLKSVAAAELAARVAWQITSNGDRVGGMVLDTTGQHMFRPFRTVKATGRLLTQVALSNQQLSRSRGVPESGAAHLEAALAALCQLRQRRNRLFIISDLAGSLQLWQKALNRLARHHHVQVLHITDPLESELPPTGVYNISQGDESLTFYSGDKTLRKRYADAHADRAANIKEICRHPSVSLQELSTASTHWNHLNWA